MPGIGPLRRVQLGKETTAGTAVAATAIVRAPKVATLEDMTSVHPTGIDETIGFASGTDRVLIESTSGRLVLGDMDCTPQQLPYFLQMGVANVSPTGTNPYTWTWTASTTSQPTIQSYTVEAGDDQQGYRAAYGFTSKVRIHGKAALKNSNAMMSATVEALQPSTNALASLSPVSVEGLLANKMKLYIDAVSGTVGTTLITNQPAEFDFDYTTGFAWFFAGGTGLVQPIKPIFTKPKALLKLRLWHDSTAVTEYANFQAGTARLIQIELPGATPASSDVKVALAGFWSKWSDLKEEGGVNYFDVEFTGAYDITAAQFCKFIVVNTLGSLP